MRAPSLAPKSRVRYEDCLRLYLLPAWGTTSTAHITREVIKRYFATLSSTGTYKGSKHRANPKPLTNGSVQKIRTVLSAVLSEAVELGTIKTNPATRLRLPAPPVRAYIALEAGAVNQLAHAIDPHYRTLIYVAAWTGLRSGELWAAAARRR